jgi:beta-mannosidase
LQNNFKLPVNKEVAKYLYQIAQAEILKKIIETKRRCIPDCMGLVYKQINAYSPEDKCSTVDYYGHWKPSQYAVQDAFSHFLVIPVIEKEYVNVYVASDALKNMDAILLAKLIDFNGKGLYVKQIPVRIDANTSKIILSMKLSELLKNADKSNCCLVVQLNQPNLTLSQNILYFTEPKKLLLSPANIDVNINEAIKGYNLIFRSSRLAKNVFLRTDSINCWFSDNNFDLLPGKRTKISVRYDGAKKQLMRDLKIRSLGDLK